MSIEDLSEAIEIPVVAVTPEDWAHIKADDRARAAAVLAKFTGAAGQTMLVPDERGRLEKVLFGLGERPDAQLFRGLAGRLPAGRFKLEAPSAGLDGEALAVAFAQGAYRFDRYRKATESAPILVPPDGVGRDSAARIAAALALARDMVNTPANDMGPDEVEGIARQIAADAAAEIRVTVGDALLMSGFPAVHAVGRAAAPHRAPRMIEIEWDGTGGAADAPRLAIVGKGVVFDSGGLDIKPSAGMRLMKKDMGGAAHALALGKMVMDARLPVRLFLLAPVVENAISGDAMRPGDVIASRKGLAIEVGNTDAEGRLILADALARAAEHSPDLTIDLATLTGAARVALGPELPPFYTDDEALAAEIADAARAAGDPVWRMPLWSGYEAAIDGDIADVANEAEPWAQAGSVTAALFLRRFAPPGAWAHFDIFAWNPRARPGWPKGAEAQAIRGLFQLFKARWA